MYVSLESESVGDNVPTVVPVELSSITELFERLIFVGAELGVPLYSKAPLSMLLLKYPR
ncbi:hypothetical protein MHK_005965 [Candidatus Magnetomorum sp. HK-1]|nr:hypothetical protein MHK_005965 [Candidatus Magnetomorum sp. HK-1]